MLELEGPWGSSNLVFSDSCLPQDPLGSPQPHSFQFSHLQSGTYRCSSTRTTDHIQAQVLWMRGQKRSGIDMLCPVSEGTRVGLNPRELTPTSSVHRVCLPSLLLSTLGTLRDPKKNTKHLYWEVGDLAASNIFLRPSMPDMASTFFLQSPTSTGRSCGQSTNMSDPHQATGATKAS